VTVQLTTQDSKYIIVVSSGLLLPPFLQDTIFIFILVLCMKKWGTQMHPGRTTPLCTIQSPLYARPFFRWASRNGVWFPQNTDCGNFNPTTSNGSKTLSIRFSTCWRYTEMTSSLKMRCLLSGSICLIPFLLLPLLNRIMPPSSKTSLCSYR